MIKLNNIPDETMDVVMEVVRNTDKRPDEVIKIMLGLVGVNEAKEAIKNEGNLQGRK